MDVGLRPSTVDKAGLYDNSFDAAYSISVIEHLPDSDAAKVMQHVWRALKPGGRFVLTIDLFLNLHPFTCRIENQFGSNMNVMWLIKQAPFLLEQGVPKVLFGFAEFNAEDIMSSLEQYLIGEGCPVLTQYLVLKKG